MKAFTLLLAALLSACGTITYRPERGASPDGVETMFIRGSAGGGLNAHLRLHRKWEEEGLRIVCDGPLVSAGALACMIHVGAHVQHIPSRGSCYTKNTTLVWHGAATERSLFLFTDWRVTKLIAERLPDPLEEMYLEHSALISGLHFARVSYEELLAVWPEGACEW